MLAVELNIPARPVVERLIEAGFITSVTAETVLRFLPPLVIRNKQIDTFVRALRAELAE